MTRTRLVNIEKLKDEISDALTISEIASELLGVELVQSGGQFKGCCPIHAENTPSFHVSDSQGVYHCFGCKAGGDYIDLVQQVQHFEFYEALYYLAKEAGINIADYERPLTHDEQIEDNIRQAANKWLASLPKPTDRGTPEALEAYNVRQGDGQIDLPTIKDYHKTGVIFPMYTYSGALVGWRARQPDKTYFATPKDFGIHEPTFFGIQVAREHIRESGEIVIVEGEYDVLAMWAVGIKNVVSIGGSAFTDDHMEILQRLKVQKAVFLLDSDRAGKDAAKKVAERWWQGDVRCFIAELPEGLDPDEIIAESGPVLLEMIIGNAKWALEYRLWIEWQDKPRSMVAKMDFLDWITATYGSLLNAAEEVIVAQHVSKWLELPEAQVLDFNRINKSQLNDPDSEAIVISKCVRNMNYYQDVRKRLVTTDFFTIRHQRIWQALEELLIEGLDFDILVVKQRAMGLGVDEEYFTQMLDSGESNMRYHEDRVADLALRREAKEKADSFRERISDLEIDASESIGTLTLDVTRKTLNGQQGFMTITDQVDKAMEVFHERMRNPNAVHGIDLGTQFPVLNQRMQGIQKKRLVLVAATSGVGKTTITVQWAVNMAVNQSIPVDYISLEMDDDELLFKATAHLTGIDGEKITSGAVTPEEAKVIEKAMMRIKKSPLRIHAPDTITPSEFVLYARESVMARRTEAFFLDYIQMASPDPGMERKQTYEQLKEFGRIAKTQIARAMNVAVICPAQLSRASGEKDRPTKEDMGDSYDLSRTADVVIILKGNEDSDMVDMWLDKNRQGSGGHLIPTMFKKDEQSFFEQGGMHEPDYRVGI